MGRAAVQHHSQSTLIGAVGNRVHLAVVHEAEVSGIITDYVDSLLREIFHQQMFHANLTAHGVTVGTVMPVNDDGIVCFDLM